MLHYRQTYVDKEQECIDSGMTFLGWDNGRANLPEEVKACREKEHHNWPKHPGLMFDVQGNDRGSANIHGCNECRWYSKYDCSD